MAAQVKWLAIQVVMGCVLSASGLMCYKCQDIVYNRTVMNIEPIRQILNGMENRNCYNREQPGTKDTGVYPPDTSTTRCPDESPSPNMIYKCGVMEGKLQTTYNARPLGMTVFVRDCILIEEISENMCYRRARQFEDRYYFADLLGAITHAVTIGDYVGLKCACTGNLCYAENAATLCYYCVHPIGWSWSKLYTYRLGQQSCLPQSPPPLNLIQVTQVWTGKTSGEVNRCGRGKQVDRGNAVCKIEVRNDITQTCMNGCECGRMGLNRGETVHGQRKTRPRSATEVGGQ
ncbi:hypothetical protein ScPMuIL_009308 [Solemya velum]